MVDALRCVVRRAHVRALCQSYTKSTTIPTCVTEWRGLGVEDRRVTLSWSSSSRRVGGSRREATKSICVRREQGKLWALSWACQSYSTSACQRLASAELPQRLGRAIAIMASRATGPSVIIPTSTVLTRALIAAALARVAGTCRSSRAQRRSSEIAHGITPAGRRVGGRARGMRDSAQCR